MEKQRLKQYLALKKEIEFTQDQLLCVQANPRLITDSVKGSSRHFPYGPRNFMITGIDFTDYDKQIEKTKKLLTRQIEALSKETTEICEYILGIEDSETRMILQCKYIKGMTWEQMEIDLNMSINTMKRRFKTWWEK